MYKTLISEPPYDKIKKTTQDKYELYIARFVQWELSKRFKRDTAFYYQRENENLAYSIYSKDVDETILKDGNITCKTFCKVAREILKEYYIDTEIISWQNEHISHTDLMIKTKNGNYVINLLSDLEYMQNSMKTNRFASEEYTQKRYSYMPKLKCISENELAEIDKCIGYPIDGIYLDDEIKRFKEKNQISEECSEEELEHYIDKVLKEFNKRRMMNGHIEFVRFYKILLHKLLDEKHLSKIEFFDLMKKKENKRTRMLALTVNGMTKIFSLSNSTYISVKKNQFERTMQADKSIVCNRVYLVNSRIDELKQMRVPKNILHHRYFKRYIINKKIQNCEIRIGKENNTVEIIRDGQKTIFLTDQNGDLNIETEDKRTIVHLVEEGVFEEKSIIKKEMEI